MPRKSIPETASTTKTAFVLALPRSLSAAEVVEQARASGMELTTQRVHKIRSEAKAKLRASGEEPSTSARSRELPPRQHTKPPHGTKSTFVRSLSPELPASEVVARAQAEGLKLSLAYVYNIRASARRDGGTSSPSRSSTPTSARPTPTLSRTRSNPTAASSDAEAKLRRLIAEVGLARARAAMVEVEAQFR